MIFFRVLKAAGVKRGMIVRSVVLKGLESLAACIPLGLACCIAMGMSKDTPSYIQPPFPLHTTEDVLITALLVCAAYATQWLLCLASSRQGYGAGHHITAALRLRVIEKLKTLPFSWFQGQSTGSIASTLMNDVMMIEHIPGLILPKIVMAGAIPLLCLGALFALDWRIAASLSVGIICCVPILILGHRHLQQTTEAHVDARSRMNGHLVEFISGIATVRRLALHTHQNGTCQKAIRHFCTQSIALIRSFVAPGILVPVSLMGGVCLVITVGTYFLLQGEMTPVLWLTYTLVALRVCGPLCELMDFSVLVQQTEASARRIVEVLDATSDVVTISGPPVTSTAIDVHDLRFSYACTNTEEHSPHKAATLTIPSLIIPERTMVAVVGKTGSGKTTLARLLIRQLHPTHGQVRIGDVDIEKIADYDLQRLITFVPQDPFFFSESIADNIRLGVTHATEHDIVEAATAAQCHDFIHHLPDGYDTRLNNGGDPLSGGERQRIALARAFLKKSPIIVLDEVTSALDVYNERLIQKALDNLVQHRTVIVIAHRLWTVRHADLILVMDKGSIAERGSHETLLKDNGLYGQLWSSLTTAPGWVGAYRAQALPS